jgi:hypothetical protein
MRMPAAGVSVAAAPPQTSGKCAACEEEKRLQTTPAGPQAAAGEAPGIVHEVLRSPGQPLDQATRAFMEPRFGYDLSKLRAHTGAKAAESAEAIGAAAYTMGHNIVFGAGRFVPEKHEGRKLIAHELTHVLQQGANGESSVLQRDTPSELKRDAPNAKAWTGASNVCPDPDFCQPLGSEMNANVRRTKYWPPLKSAIGLVVSSRVTPLWDDWAYGGISSVRDLTKDFGADFLASPTTAKTSKVLLDDIKAKLTASPPTIPVGGSLKIDIPTLIPAAVKAIDDPGNRDEMNFALISDIPGNIAGGIGKDQASTPIGKTPSTQNDERIAKGEVEVMDAGASLVVLPHLSYTVKDTVDLCPGNCGAKREQTATIPMSRWEATGISGDVPFIVDFPAPALLGLPYSIPKPAAPVAPPVLPPAPTKTP